MRRIPFSFAGWSAVTCAVLSLIVLGFGQSAAAQKSPTATTVASSVQTIVPQLIKFSGTLTDLAGKPISGPVDVTFSLYSEESGGTPLWYESQTVNANAAGEYTTLLGAMTATGVPMDLFTSGQARWLGVAVRGLPEQSRILLVSVPYAMTSGNSEMLGGKPAADYLLASQSGTSSTTTAALVGTSSTSSRSTSKQLATASPQSITAGGTANYLAAFVNSSGTLGNSNIYQNPTTNNIGIGTTTPGYALTIVTNAPGQGIMLNAQTYGAAYHMARAGVEEGFFSVAGATGGFSKAAVTNDVVFGAHNATSGGNLILTTQNATGSIKFATGSSAGNDTVKMTVTNAGNVGIGTANPTSLLDVAGTGGANGTSITVADQVDATAKYGYAQSAFQLSNPNFNGGAGKTIFSFGAEGFMGDTGVVGATDFYIYDPGSGSYEAVFRGNENNGGGVIALGPNIKDLSTLSDAGLTLDSSGNVNVAGTLTAASFSGDLKLAATSSGGSAGVISLDGTPFIQAYGIENSFVGAGAGNFTMTGEFNTAIGSSALTADTTGHDDTASGREALFSNTTGYNNTASGSAALAYNTTGNENTASGSGALEWNTTGYSNTANGAGALWANTKGYENTASGASALDGNTTGYDNTANGLNTLELNTTGNYNTASGYNALYANTTGSNNTAFGSSALGIYRYGVSIITGNNNTAIGGSALGNDASGGNNTAVGNSTGEAITAGVGDTFLGYGANASSGTLTNATAIGALAYVGESNALVLGSIGGTNGAGASVNVGIGTATPSTALEVNGTVTATALQVNGTVTATNFSGDASGLTNVGGSTTVISGSTATLSGNLKLPATSSDGSAGVINLNGTAFIDAYGTDNSFVGQGAGNFTMTGSLNTAVGASALTGDTTGDYNTAIGSSALTANTTGSANTASGYATLLLNSTGSHNAAIGGFALSQNSGGADNTAVGYSAGSAMTTGSDNTFLGHSANASSGTLTNATAIGALAYVGESNALVLGSISGTNGAGTSVNVGIGTATPGEPLDVSGNIRTSTCFLAGSTTVGGTCSSDKRLKTDIRNFTPSLDRLAELQPVRFNWRASNPAGYRFGSDRSTGLVAQQVRKIFPQMVATDKNGYYQVNYSLLPFMLLAGEKQLKARNDILRAQVTEARAQIASLRRIEAAKDSEVTALAAQNRKLAGEVAQLKKTASAVEALEARLNRDEAREKATQIKLARVMRQQKKNSRTELARVQF